ncbi:MAG TPA: hypothetical protein VEL71_03155 [Candidatus Dormibacteraeota bacterium]|nr:hypothetical protein [Candidatus Dormibacteraeota bacterium]
MTDWQKRLRDALVKARLAEKRRGKYYLSKLVDTFVRLVLFFTLALYLITALLLLAIFGLFDIREAITTGVVLFGVELILALFLRRSDKDREELLKAIKQLNKTSEAILEYLKENREQKSEK